MSEAMLAARFRAAGRLPASQQPEFRIAAMENVRFETVAGLMALGNRAGVARVGLD